MAEYQWLTLPTALTNIQDRLNDAGVFWPIAEQQIYLIESLRILNALTESFRTQYLFTPPANPNSPASTAWINLGLPMTSPRRRTVTDADLATQIEYMLLEPAVGISAWAGTTQFSVEKIQSSLQVRQNEIIQASGCNTVNIPLLPTVPSQTRYSLTDTDLELRRIRYLQTNPDNSISYWYLKRSDTQAFHYFDSDYPQEVEVPIEWSVASEPPLSFDANTMPNTEGNFDILVLQSGAQFSDTPTVLSIPNDWTWLLVYGTLADLLSEEPESSDRTRAAYCAKRYQDGLEMLRNSNWLQQAFVNGFVASTPSLENKDRWSIGWQEDTGGIPAVVTDGIDQISVAPFGAGSCSLTLIKNAPLLDSTSTWVQVSRDDWDQCLNYIQHIASFKLGGSDFMATSGLLDEFLAYCVSKNRRQMTYGLYTDILNSAGRKQDVDQPR